MFAVSALKFVNARRLPPAAWSQRLEPGAQPFEAARERVAAAGERDAQRAFAAGAVRGAMNHGDAGVVQQPPADLVRTGRRSRARPPSRRIRLRAASTRTSANARSAQSAPAPGVRVYSSRISLDASCGPVSADGGRVLDERRRPAARLLQRQNMLWMIGAGAAQ